MKWIKSFSDLLTQVSQILDQGDFSDASIATACAKIVKFADQMHSQLSKTAAFAPYSQDDTPLALVAETSADAIGEQTLAQSSLKAGLIDYKNVTIALGTATSTAVAEGGAEVAATAAFTEVVGSNLVFTETYTGSGVNWQKSTQAVFAIDFKFLDDDICFALTREATLLTDSRLSTCGGNVAQAEFDVTASGTNTAVQVVADALAVEDTISSTYIGTDLLVG